MYDHDLPPQLAAVHISRIGPSSNCVMADGCRDALWLPYRKDRAQLKDAIEGAGPIKAVFAHADVVSAHGPICQDIMIYYDLAFAGNAGALMSMHLLCL